jgi:hypothetical protein
MTSMAMLAWRGICIDRAPGDQATDGGQIADGGPPTSATRCRVLTGITEWIKSRTGGRAWHPP